MNQCYLSVLVLLGRPDRRWRLQAPASVFPKKIGTAGDARRHLPWAAGSAGRPGVDHGAGVRELERKERREGCVFKVKGAFRIRPCLPFGWDVLNSFPSKSWRTYTSYLPTNPRFFMALTTFFIFVFIPKTLEWELEPIQQSHIFFFSSFANLLAQKMFPSLETFSGL